MFMDVSCFDGRKDLLERYDTLSHRFCVHCHYRAVEQR